MNKIVKAMLAAALPAAASAAVTFTVHPGMKRQPIDGFGASDAWSMRFVGEMLEPVQTQTADWLFSTENDPNGNPKGIGLSIWRFNIGAGSVEQGEASQINSGTRTECFLLEDGSYDWTRQAGQRRFLRLAKERGVPTFLGFLNSPPVYYTQNGLATNTGRGSSYNLQPYMYDDYARFLADVVQGLEKHDGIKLDYISPVNEPDGHWNWQGPKQEGSLAHNDEIARVARELDAELTRRGMDTKIIIPESSDYRCMFGIHMTDWRRGYEIDTFFSPDSANYVGDLTHLPKLMAGHSYWSNTPVEAMKENRIRLNEDLKKHGVDFWQSEVCIMGNDEEIGGGGGYDRTMKTALYVARMLHHDLVYANARSWQWWRAIGGDYKDGLLFQHRPQGCDADVIDDSKLLWSLGNWSRFVRPGAERVGVTLKGSKDEDSATDPWGLMCSAFRNADGKYVVVIINYGNDAQTVSINGLKGNVWSAYRTSDVEVESLRHVADMNSLKGVAVPARSITTFVED